MKKILMLLLFVMCFTLSACSDEDIEDFSETVTDAANRVQNIVEDETVLSIKNATNSNYPGKTYGEAFDSFFSSPSWRHFEGSTDDSDEVYDVVEFTGGCTYQDVDVEALVQFTLYDDGTFSPTYLSFNEVPQNMLMISGLMEAVFTNDDSTSSSSAETDTVPSVPDNSNSENQTSSSYGDNDFTGKWWDVGYGRTQITISQNGDEYDIYVNGSNGATSGVEYYLTGYYDTDQNAVIYEGEKSTVESGVSYVQSVNESGKFYFSDGYLYWYDNTDNESPESGPFERMQQ